MSMSAEGYYFPEHIWKGLPADTVGCGSAGQADVCTLPRCAGTQAKGWAHSPNILIIF